MGRGECHPNRLKGSSLPLSAKKERRIEGGDALAFRAELGNE